MFRHMVNHKSNDENYLFNSPSNKTTDFGGNTTIVNKPHIMDPKASLSKVMANDLTTTSTATARFDLESDTSKYWKNAASMSAKNSRCYNRGTVPATKNPVVAKTG